MLVLVLILIHTSRVCATPSRCVSIVDAQTLKGEDVQLEIRSIKLNSSTKTTQSPQASAEFMREGYLLQTLPIDRTVSRSFISSPRAYLLRAKPGTKIKLPLTINNYRSAAVLELKLVPFNAQSSIDCSVVEMAACTALNWISIDSNSKKLFMGQGEVKEVLLDIAIPETAIEGDYYLSIHISEFNKPYHYISTELYLTITKDGIIGQNISTEDLAFTDPLLSFRSLRRILPTIVRGDQVQKLLVKVNNGSPVYGVADITLIAKSPLGFEKTVATAVQVVLGNTSTKLPIDVEKLPLGPLTLSVGDNVEIPALVLPNPIVITIFLVLLVIATWSFIMVKKSK